MKKNIQKILSLTGAISMLGFLGCEEPENATPRPDTTPITLSSNVIFANASPDAGSLDLLMNGLKVGESAATGSPQAAYTAVPLTAAISLGQNANTGAPTSVANTSLRAKATTGTIGGVLGSSDLILRAGSTNSNNFTAANNARYTLFALDSITRPKPIRTLNADNFADTTFFNPLTGKYISRVEKAALPAAQRAKVVAIGIVPLGSTDPGGIRFLVITETLPTFTLPNTTQSAIRIINASPNSTNLYVRLKPVAAGSNITLGSNLPYVLSAPALTGTGTTYVPSVGSRFANTTPANPNINTHLPYVLQTTASASVPIDYNIEVSTDAGFTNIVHTSGVVTFAVGKIYTVYVKGFRGSVTTGIVTHN